MKADLLPESFLNKMAAADRKLLGRPALLASERQAQAGLKLEREIHKLIWNELLRRGIFAIHSRTDKRTTNAVGLPDFCMAINGHPVAIEVKLPGEKLTEEQEAVSRRMVQNGWQYFIVYSFEEAIVVINSKAFGSE